MMRIHQTQNEYLIGEVERLIDTIEAGSELFTSNPEQKTAVQEALDAIESGNHISEVDVEKEIGAWLRK